MKKEIFCVLGIILSLISNLTAQQSSEYNHTLYSSNIRGTHYYLEDGISINLTEQLENLEYKSLDTTTIRLEQYFFKSWQLIGGYSFNNSGVTNLEISYMCPLADNLGISFDLRLYSFLSFSFSALLFPIQVSEKFSFVLKAGIGIIPLASMVNVGVQSRYKLSSTMNLILEYKQISPLSRLTGFITFSPDFTISNYPIRLISIGIEF